MTAGQSLRTFSWIRWLQASYFIGRALWAVSSKNLSQQQDCTGPPVVPCSKWCSLSTWEEGLVSGSRNRRQSGSLLGPEMLSVPAPHLMADSPGQYCFHPACIRPPGPLGGPGHVCVTRTPRKFLFIFSRIDLLIFSAIDLSSTLTTLFQVSLQPAENTYPCPCTSAFFNTDLSETGLMLFLRLTFAHYSTSICWEFTDTERGDTVINKTHLPIQSLHSKGREGEIKTSRTINVDISIRGKSITEM